MKNPVLFVQSVLAALQLANLGPALQGVGLPTRYVILFAALTGCVQLALTMYQHGAAQNGPASAPQSPVAAPTAPVATPAQGAPTGAIGVSDSYPAK